MTTPEAGSMEFNGTNLFFTPSTVRKTIAFTENIPTSHNAVAIGTANGLSLSNQVLSLGVASTSVTGALTSTDWNIFNNKVSFPGFGTTGTTAAYGDHTHSYDNYQNWRLGYFSGEGYVYQNIYSTRKVTFVNASVINDLDETYVEYIQKAVNLYSAYTDVANYSSTATNIYVYTLPAYTLNSNGDSLDLVYSGTGAANSNMKTIDFKFGNATAGQMANNTASATNWSIHITLVRSSSSTLRFTIRNTWDTASATYSGEWNSIDLVDSNTIKLVFTSGATNDIIAKMATITKYIQ